MTDQQPVPADLAPGLTLSPDEWARLKAELDEPAQVAPEILALAQRVSARPRGQARGRA